jgi:hypothetical protein
MQGGKDMPARGRLASFKRFPPGDSPPCIRKAWLVFLLSVLVAAGLMTGVCPAQPAPADPERFKHEPLLKGIDLNQTDALKMAELRDARELKEHELNQAWTLGLLDLGLKLAAGVFALAAAITGWNSYKVSQQGQITDRFTTGIESLGDDASITKRIGGVHALERIAKDSEYDRWAVMEVLAGFVRDRYSGANRPIVTPVDIQAILTVLGRRKHDRETNDQRVDLHNTDLRRFNLREAKMQRTIFTEAHLNATNLEKADLSGADLTRSDLRGANLRGANLRGADLTGMQENNETDFSGARADNQTRWPVGFNPGARGVIID